MEDFKMDGIQFLVFDFDGTLAESRFDLAKAVNRVRVDYGLTELPTEQIVPMIREGVQSLMTTAVGREVGLSMVEEACASFMKHYFDCCVDTTECYEGVETMLEELADRYSLAILSNKPESILRKILSELDLNIWFEEIVGGDTLDGVRKPNPESLTRVLSRMGGRAEHSVMIGDTETDAATAEAAGCPFILAEWGFARKEDLPGIRAAYRAESMASLWSALASGTAAKLSMIG